MNLIVDPMLTIVYKMEEYLYCIVPLFHKTKRFESINSYS